MHRCYRLKFLGIALLLSGCGEAPSPPSRNGDAAPAFVGSVECRSCHEREFAEWTESHHDLAMQVVNATTVRGDFDDSVVDYYGATTRFFSEGGDYFVRTQNDAGDPQTFRLAYTFGVEPLQQYLVEFSGGRLQALPFAWDTRVAASGGQRWYHLYPDEHVDPSHPLHWTRREQNWNYQCAECHSTNLQTNYDPTNDRFDTTWSDIDVGCEACHGPGSRHIGRAEAGVLQGGSGFPVDLDDRGGAVWQMDRQTGIAARSRLRMRPPQQPESCGRCHARRGLITSQYEYGKPLADTHRPALLNPPLYFSDGQIREEVYVYGSFLQSRMYQAGVSCSDCHNPHSLELVTGEDPSGVCAQCHLPERFSSKDHHKHPPEQVACVDCHMRSRVYMGVDERRDHSFRIPRPAATLTSGSPNACNACHAENGAEWAAARAAEWWGDELPQDGGEAPGIVRATALSMLRMPLAESDARRIERSLGDPDALVRMAAVRAAHGLPPERQLRLLPPLLGDGIRSVRLEAIGVLAPLMEFLPAAARPAFEQAANDFRDAQRVVGSRPEAYAALGQFEANLGDIDTALGHVRQGLEFAPHDPLLRHTHGLLLVRSGQRLEALQEFRKAAELAPDSARFVYVYAVALNSMGEPDEAIRILAGARQRFPEDFDIGWALATMKRDGGDIAGARKVALQLADVFADDPSVTRLLESLNPD